MLDAAAVDHGLLVLDAVDDVSRWTILDFLRGLADLPRPVKDDFSFSLRPLKPTTS